jgi:Immunoglobulin-like domain of bacterial spore germination
MRHLRRLRAATVLVSLTALLALAGCSTAGSGGSTADGATPTSTTGDTTGGQPGSTAAGGVDQPASTAADTTATSAGSAAGSATAKQAEATAVYFLRTEIGMRRPVAMPFKPTGKDTGEVGVYPGKGSEGGEPLPRSITTVRLRRQQGGWEVTGTRSPSVRVTQPAAGALVASPVRLTGSAHAFEGNVAVQVHDNRNGKDQTLGEGFVTGGGDMFRPFSGSVRFRSPSTTTGWVVFFVRSPADGQVTEATFVRVRFK